MQVYLDNSATTKQAPEVTKSMIEMMEKDYGNPSSLHHLGVVAEQALKNSRKQIANAISADQNGIFFTSGGTEADNIAIIGTAKKKKRLGKRIVTQKTEHPAVLESCKNLEDAGFEVIRIDVDKDGIIDLDLFEKAITDETILITCMHVNNETGAIQPIEKIAAMKKNATLHVDCVQSFGKLPLPTNEADIISISGHKIHGPKGIGCIWYRDPAVAMPLMFGGGQEKGIRSGTENMPGIVGMGVAADNAAAKLTENQTKLRELRDMLLKGFTEIDDVMMNSPHDGCPNIINVSFLGTRGEVILHTLASEGIFVSTGSACSSHHGGGSHVLKAMGKSDESISSAIRFSLSHMNTKEEISYTIENVKAAVDAFRNVRNKR